MKSNKSLAVSSLKSLQDRKLREAFELQKIREEKRLLREKEIECLSRLQNLHQKIYWELSNNKEELEGTEE